MAQLKDVDSRTRTELLVAFVRLAGPIVIILTAAETRFLGWPLPVALVVNLVVAALATGGIHLAASWSAAGVINMAHAAGGIPRPPDFSAQDTLIVRGRYAEAAESFQKHLLGHPEDNEARLRLAQLYERELADPRQAEEWYLAARRRGPTRQQEALIANSLIDLFRRNGQRGRLMAELSKFADRYKGTGAGDAAARELADLKAKP